MTDNAMARRETARSAALKVLTQMKSSGAWADAALNAEITRDGLSPQDAALATRLVYGVLQNRMLLDHWLSAYCSQKLDHLQPPLADILRLGAYQIVLMDKIPDSAAVNESVNLAKTFGRAKASGLVNAVLRKIVQNRDALPPVPEKDAVQYLSLTYSHPKWLVKRLLALLGREEAEAFLRADNETAPMTVQVNTLKTDPEALSRELEEAGVSVRPHAFVPGCLELGGTGNLTRLSAFREGRFLVQDPAARLVTAASGVRPGMRMIDVCAAPGGKTFSAAIAMENRGSILSCDLYENKLRRILDGATRLGISCVETAATDGRLMHPEWKESADLVLVDAPCSGLGIIRKKPEIRYKTADELFSLPMVQSAILSNAADYVKPGGTLVYSTCTILPEENEHITDAFLAEHPEFQRETFCLPEPLGQIDGQITLWPQRHQVDGFYICRMTKRRG